MSVLRRQSDRKHDRTPFAQENADRAQYRQAECLLHFAQMKTAAMQ